MLRPTSLVPALHLDRAALGRLDAAELDDLVASSPTGVSVLEWGGSAAGLFARLRRAAEGSHQVFPGRWFAAPEVHGFVSARPSRLFWVARNDAALARLFEEEGPRVDGGLPRPDDPLCLLGLPGDVLHGLGSAERRRAATGWLHRLGHGRVALVAPAGDEDDVLAHLAHEEGCPLFLLAAPGERVRLAGFEAGGTPALLTPEFLLDAEYRLPDAAFVPALRDLLARGSLLHERTLHDRLPEAWKEQAEREISCLQGWQLVPLLRRTASLLQTVQPVAEARVAAPFPQLRGVVAWLLGLGDVRPDAAALAPEAAADQARELAAALHGWDRRLVVELPAGPWNRVRHRLLPWAEGGHLALCADAGPHGARRFCFSGQPLWRRVPVPTGADGLPHVDLEPEDRRALGWFELELRPVVRTAAPEPGAPLAPVTAMPVAPTVGEAEQLGLAFPSSR